MERSRLEEGEGVVEEVLEIREESDWREEYSRGLEMHRLVAVRWCRPSSLWRRHHRLQVLGLEQRVPLAAPGVELHTTKL